MTIEDYLMRCREAVVISKILIPRLEAATTHPLLSFQERHAIKRVKAEAESVQLTSRSALQSFQKMVQQGSITMQDLVPAEVISLPPVLRMLAVADLRDRAEALLDRAK